MAKQIEKKLPTKYAKTNKEENLFTAADFFMLRLPLFPLENFYELNQMNDYLTAIKEYARDEKVREAILISSPSLYAALPNLEDDPTSRKTKQTLSSFIRYFLRMSTRATPYGLFAGVALGSLTDKTDFLLGSCDYNKKRTRPDMEWLLAIIKKLEQRLDVVKQLKVQKNHASLQVGGRIELALATEYGQIKRLDGMQKERISIRATEVVYNVFALAEHPILFEELIARLIEKYPEAGEQRVTGLLWQLFSQEFLISELRPPLTIANPFDYVMARLKLLDGVQDIFMELAYIQEEMKRYDELPIGKGIQAYQELLARMKAIEASDTPIQVDFHLASNKVCLHNGIGEEVAKVAECLWRLSFVQRGATHLRSYHKDFLERYGTSREIPVLELLSEEIGLGAPAGYMFPSSTRREIVSPPKYSDQREAIVMRKVIQAIATKKREIEITNDLLEQLDIDPVNPKYAPDSLEMYVEVIASSQEAIDKGEYLLEVGAMPGSSKVGQSFGRFLDILGTEAIEKHEQVHKQVQGRLEDVIMVDAVYLPAAGRMANIMLHPSLSEYELSIGTNSSEKATHSLLLEDIVVCATVEHMYLKSRKHGKKIIISSDNMLNFRNSPNVYRFLREVSLENVRNWQPFSWGNMEGSPYLPRVRYGKTILSPAIWNMMPSSLGLKENPKADQLWYDAFSKWRREWDIPRYVYMAFGDNRILLDLDNSYHVEEIRSELFKSKSIQFREKIGGVDEYWVNGPEGHFTMECVVPLIKKKELQKMNLTSYRKTKVLSKEQYIRFPGSDWLFIKLYGGQYRQNDFIVDEIRAFADSMVQKGAAEEWFFMRYLDPDHHIRLRFHGNPEKLLQEILPELYRWIQECQRKGFIQRMVIDTYDREIERYGGPTIMADAERVFSRDSQTTVKLLELLRYKQTNLPDYVLATISIIDIMTRFGLSFEQQFEWMEQVVKKDAHRAEFRKWRKTLLTLADPRNDWQGLRSHPSGEEIREAFYLRTDALTTFGKLVSEGEQNKSLWNSPATILGSLIHLHCNRIFGVNREMEEKAMAFVRHTLHSQLHWRENVGNSI
ncbi:lantibiotic dehydratase [Brevibacillus halotolerans]|uniref:lantibiotic dehydratase n=1 Tax=Brevibacillus TaxID=55080 RepID=UPI00215C0C03|nr:MULTISPECIES: lantibiotic dehydratase [Brevibacillus]MCR8966190.1 lantibiotic dehydratase [Brevibacillus laterosporus]MCZ0838347.1 lantibiotic dehydratase [Brevibacillus halotolerans]